MSVNRQCWSVSSSTSQSEVPDWSIRTSHVSEFFSATTVHIVAVLGLYGILDGTGDGVVYTQNWALDQLDLSGSVAAKTAASTSSTSSTSGRLSLPPSLSGGSLTASIGRRDATRNSKCRCRVVVLAWVNWPSAVRVGRVGCVSLGQAIAGRGTLWRDTARVRVIKWGCKGTLLLGQQSTRGIFLLRILDVESVDIQSEMSILKHAPGRLARLADGGRLAYHHTLAGVSQSPSRPCREEKSYIRAQGWVERGVKQGAFNVEITRATWAVRWLSLEQRLKPKIGSRVWRKERRGETGEMGGGEEKRSIE